MGLGLSALLIPWLLGIPLFRGDSTWESGAGTIERWGIPTRPPGTCALIERLIGTNLLNADEVHGRLVLEDGDERAAGFLTPNPFEPRYREAFQSVAGLRYPLPDNGQSDALDDSAGTFYFLGQEPVLRWYGSLDSNTEVCGVQFVDPGRNDYRLRTFPDQESALKAGYIVTHSHHCGTCSSLHDLAVYLSQPDLVTPVRGCARKFTASGIKECLMDQIGFSEHCAETWAYNTLHTRGHCLNTCIRHFGLWDVLTNDMGNRHTNKDGDLNPCLACDEFKSGPGFHYAAGRTRRTSGLESAIYRPPEAVYPVDHRLYFE